ncbi:APC family permease [Micromonospora sp. CA-263727]|uniref:APC family permease n=1 Tax=Micromonospora sp. CA-263727 TaxID=3239967 RepID=UPI003D8BA042
MSGQIGVARGTALYVGAVLGPGVLVLPALAADAAGPASVLAWAILIAVSAPVAAAFAALGMRYPDSGGVATYTRQAFGPTAGTIVGWWFYAAVPIGMVAGALAGGRYAAAALGFGPTWAAGIAAALLIAAYTLNLFGLHLSGRIHLMLTAGLVVLLATVIAVSLPRVAMDNFTPFAPHGFAGVGSAAVVLFVAVCGWEAAVNLAPAFTRPRRQMPIVAAASLSIITLLYIGLAVTTIGVLGPKAADTGVPLIRLVNSTSGVGASVVTAACALLLTFGATFTFIAAAAHGGAALARDRALPRWLAATSRANVPRRSLGVQGAAAAIVATATGIVPLDIDLLMRAFAVLMASVSVIGLAAAARLLTSRTIRAGAVIAIVVVGAVAALGGQMLALPAALGAIAAAWQHRQPPGRRITPTLATPKARGHAIRKGPTRPRSSHQAGARVAADRAATRR